MHSLTGKTAIVTGTRRIGAVVARRLAAEGVQQALFYNTSRDHTEALAGEIRSTAGQAVALQCNIGSERQVAKACRAAVTVLGHIDFLVHMASGFERVPFDKLNGAAWDRALIDAKGTYLLTIEAARLIQKNQGPTKGHILTFGDWAADGTAYDHYLPYLVAKSAVHYMTRAFGFVFAGEGILVNTIAPGPTMRPESVSENRWKTNVVDEAPLRREASANDVAEMVVTLLKAESVTGEVVRIDSGHHLGKSRMVGRDK